MVTLIIEILTGPTNNIGHSGDSYAQQVVYKLNDLFMLMNLQDIDIMRHLTEEKSCVQLYHNIMIESLH